MKDLPQTIRTTAKDLGKVEQTIEDFFKDTINSIKQKQDATTYDFNVRLQELSGNPPQITDERVRYLTYKNKIIANVFETRTPLNNLQFSFFRNTEINEIPRKTIEEFFIETKNLTSKYHDISNYEIEWKQEDKYLINEEETTKNRVPYIKLINNSENKETILANAFEMNGESGDKSYTFFRKITLD